MNDGLKDIVREQVDNYSKLGQTKYPNLVHDAAMGVVLLVQVLLEAKKNGVPGGGAIVSRKLLEEIWQFIALPVPDLQAPEREAPDDARGGSR